MPATPSERLTDFVAPVRERVVREFYMHAHSSSFPYDVCCFFFLFEKRDKNTAQMNKATTATESCSCKLQV